MNRTVLFFWNNKISIVKNTNIIGIVSFLGFDGLDCLVQFRLTTRFILIDVNEADNCEGDSTLCSI